QADTIVFIVSPHSVGSKVCAWEVEQVRTHGKRLAPVVIAEVQSLSVPDEIAKINYLFFTDDAQFEQRADELARALNTDVAWLKEHTRFSELARRWAERGSPDDALVRGRELDEGEAWAARRPRDAPVVSEQLRGFLAASRVGEAIRLKRQRQLQKRAAWALSTVALLVVAGLVAVLWQARETARREARVLTSLAQKAIDEGFYDRAMRIAVHGLAPPGALPFIESWSDGLE